MQSIFTYLVPLNHVNKNSGMDLIGVCPKLMPVNIEGTLFRGFITAEVPCLSYVSIVTRIWVRLSFVFPAWSESGRGRGRRAC